MNQVLVNTNTILKNIPATPDVKYVVFVLSLAVSFVLCLYCVIRSPHRRYMYLIYIFTYDLNKLSR